MLHKLSSVAWDLGLGFFAFFLLVSGLASSIVVDSSSDDDMEPEDMNPDGVDTGEEFDPVS